MFLVILLCAAILFIVFTTTRFKLHPFIALLLAALGFGLLSGMEPINVVNSINEGFGNTVGYIGIVILAGTIIGTFLEKSGGAYKLAESALKITGKKNVPLAMGSVGYIVSMPVFCDSGFIILSPLNKALANKAKSSLAAGAVALSLGLYATHTMVPPTPGPVAAAGIIKADLGQVILWGILVSLAALAAGWIFAIKYASRVELTDNISEKEINPSSPIPKDQPSTLLSVLPIITPIILIVLQSIAQFPSKPFGQNVMVDWIIFLGQPVVALLTGVFLALLLPKKLDGDVLSVNGWTGEAVMTAASIIIITGTGGAFGKVLQNSGIAHIIGTGLQNTQIGIILPFLIAAGIKTAQGSSTVAIITTAGLIEPLIEPLGLSGETAKALIVVAIGAGAMVVSHINDSYFWVVTQFSNMTVKQGYKLQTLGTLVEGLAAILTILVLSIVLL